MYFYKKIMDNATPLFIVSSGRSGTQMFERILSTQPEIESHHEYLCTNVQRIACLWVMKKIDRNQALLELEEIYLPALTYCSAPIFADSSNKVSWIIELLVELFPESRFIYTVRDGRKVTSSYFHKLNDECYDDRSVDILRGFVDNNLLAPPTEKKYYWPLPIRSDPAFDRFYNMDQFGRICWHWGAINRSIINQLQGVRPDRQFFCRLEDLVSNEDVVRRMWKFLDLEYKPEIFLMLQRPHNINKPIDILLTPKQYEMLLAEAKDVIQRFGYDKEEEYSMRYG